MDSIVSTSSGARNPLYPALTESKETRLIWVQPGSWEDDIHCKFSQMSLVLDNNVPAYTALSYAWGSPGVKNPIWVTGQQLLVTVNLECALRHLRLSDRPVLLWVDAIVCPSVPFCCHDSR